MTDTTTGRVAVITGASSGIGQATARELAAAGYTVALLARRLDRITALADELGNGAIAIESDVTDRDSIIAAAQRVQDELGGADVLVNNAGIMLLGPFGSDQRGDYRAMLEVNVLGAITATRLDPKSIGWQTANGKTTVYVNTGGSRQSLTSTSMKIDLAGTVALSDQNFAHL